MKTLSRLVLVTFVLVTAMASSLVPTRPAYADQFFTSGPFTVTITRLNGEWKHYGYTSFETLGNLAAVYFTVSQSKAMGQGGCQPWVSNCPDASHSAWIATSRVWLDSSVSYCEYNDRYGRPACDFVSSAWSAPGFGYGLNEYAPGTLVYGEWFLECSLGWDCPGGNETVTVTFTLVWYGAPPAATVTPTPTSTPLPTDTPTATLAGATLTPTITPTRIEASTGTPAGGAPTPTAAPLGLEPVILLPGGTASTIAVSQAITPTVPDGHSGNFTLTYQQNEEVWGKDAIAGLIRTRGKFDYFDILKRLWCINRALGVIHSSRLNS